jgi:tripartite-type tricarboxylate transporter receptor subunit TctC
MPPHRADAPTVRECQSREDHAEPSYHQRHHARWRDAPGRAWTGQTEDYPSRPVRLVITTPAGSLVDVLGRLFAQDLSDRLGQTIVVDNRPGAMTQIGADALNRASPDGYTLMIVTSEATMLPFLKKSYRYDPVKDFTPIALLATSWTVFAINP